MVVALELTQGATVITHDMLMAIGYQQQGTANIRHHPVIGNWYAGNTLLGSPTSHLEQSGPNNEYPYMCYQYPEVANAIVLSAYNQIDSLSCDGFLNNTSTHFDIHFPSTWATVVALLTRAAVNQRILGVFLCRAAYLQLNRHANVPAGDTYRFMGYCTVTCRGRNGLMHSFTLQRANVAVLPRLTDAGHIDPPRKHRLLITRCDDNACACVPHDFLQSEYRAYNANDLVNVNQAGVSVPQFVDWYYNHHIAPLIDNTLVNYQWSFDADPGINQNLVPVGAAPRRPAPVPWADWLVSFFR
jgi:hypothetical protein